MTYVIFKGSKTANRKSILEHSIFSSKKKDFASSAKIFPTPPPGGYPSLQRQTIL